MNPNTLAPDAHPYALNDAGNIAYGRYQKDALRTEKPLGSIVADKHLFGAVLAIAVAAGDLADLLKKNVVYGKETTEQQFEEKIEALLQAGDDALTQLYRADASEEPLLVNPRLLHGVLGGFGEKAELLELLLAQTNGEPLDPMRVVDEAGDACWYQALELDEIEQMSGVGLAGVLLANRNKLALRHGGKPLTLESSENKNREAEMAAVVAGAGISQS